MPANRVVEHFNVLKHVRRRSCSFRLTYLAIKGLRYVQPFDGTPTFLPKAPANHVGANTATVQPALVTVFNLAFSGSDGLQSISNIARTQLSSSFGQTMSSVDRSSSKDHHLCSTMNCLSSDVHSASRICVFEVRTKKYLSSAMTFSPSGSCKVNRLSARYQSGGSIAIPVSSRNSRTAACS